MINKYDVFCISAGQIKTKKDASIINKRNLYLNYGLLSLTSLLKQNKLNSIQLQGNFTPPDIFFENCIKMGILETKHPILISMPSFYALSWVFHFTKILKINMPKSKVILGGRWVIDGRPDLLKKHLPYVDHIIDGLGENSIFNFLTKIQFHSKTNTSH